ncbi:MAG: hypothetical protein WD182_07600, partial [Bacteroidota bacterium]
CRRQIAEGRLQKADCRRQIAEGRRRKTDGRLQMADGRRQTANNEREKQETVITCVDKPVHFVLYCIPFTCYFFSLPTFSFFLIFHF